ncbi:pseudouridine synthase [Pelagophyceae sp. CCMP2097]|nr:pseudouridine synthase [Pelagophyceae sp. CCMP2097]|mmetsp:Transcript_1949/g.7112  ORF Transcript_1949/g.7112 Transcript_1949/m.7112 type:complete len:259 (+) Transcript_1949:66-842(+)
MRASALLWCSLKAAGALSSGAAHALGAAAAPAAPRLAANHGPHSHFRISKPGGFLSQLVCAKRKPRQRLLGELFDFPAGTMAVGRLDEMSEGLLLLTTDGQVSYRVTTGGFFEKEYWVQVQGVVSAEALEKLQKGLALTADGEKFTTKPCTASLLQVAPDFGPRARARVQDTRKLLDGTFLTIPTTWLSVVLREGKNRQVRKMTAAVGHPTLRLVRVRIGHVTLDGLEQGDVEQLPQWQVDPFLLVGDVVDRAEAAEP